LIVALKPTWTTSCISVVLKAAVLEACPVTIIWIDVTFIQHCCSLTPDILTDAFGMKASNPNH
jgi:hypothetical protein